MAPTELPDYATIRASRLIAEALVKRQSPTRIAQKARRHGISRELARTMVIACGATSMEPHDQRDGEGATRV